jgi:hypothetical protein
MSQVFYNWTTGAQAKQYNTFSLLPHPLPSASGKIQTLNNWCINQVFYYCATWGTNEVIELFLLFFLHGDSGRI